MALLVKCWACVDGDHEHCLIEDSTRQEGVLGGWRCNCACRSAQEPAAPAVMKAKQGLPGPMGRLP